MWPEVFTPLPKFYPWDTPQYWDTLLMQSLYETYTDRKLSGEPSEPSEVSLKEKSLIPLQQRVFDLYHLMDEMIVNGTRRLETTNNED